MRRYKIVEFLILFSVSTNITFGALSFSEIMYDPEGADTGREWVEIRNDGDQVAINSYKLFESNTNHAISSFQGGAVLSSGGYAIIADNPAKFLEDFPSYTGVLFDSSFSLSNAGELLVLKDSAGQTLDSLTYSPALGGNDDGTTLSKFESGWGRGDPTPGSSNVLSLKSASTTIKGGVTPLLSSPSVDLTLFLPEEKLVVAGADADFSTSALTSGGVEPSNMTYEWSFGDGGIRTGKSISYHYAESGIYLVIVEAHNGLVFAKGRMKVRAVEPTILVTDVKKTNEKVIISIKNTSAHEIDVGKWKIGTGGLRYDIPKNTIVLPRMETKMSGLELGMSTSTFTLGTTSLIFPGGQILASSTYYVGQVNSTLSNNAQVQIYPQGYRDENQQGQKNKVITFSDNKEEKKGKNDTLKTFSTFSSNPLTGDTDSSKNILSKKVNVVNGKSVLQTSEKILDQDLLRSSSMPSPTHSSKDTTISDFLKKLWPF